MNRILLPVSLFVTLCIAVAGHAQSVVDRNEGSVQSFTEPYRSIEVAAPEMGIVTEILVEEGSQVVAGTILARMNEEVIAASRDVAEEQSRARGKLKTALAEMELQQERFEKVSGLFNRNHASTVELDRARTQFNVATARVETVREDIRVRELELKKIEAQLEQRRIRSPINGVVTDILKDVGEFVSPSEPVVAKVIQLDPLLVIFSVPQEDASTIQPGQTISLQIGQETDRAKGIVEFISPDADAQSGTRRVKIRIDNPELRWPSGVTCRVSKSDLAAAARQQRDESKSLQVSHQQ